MVELVVAPAGFFAKHVYSPACSAWTESMFSWLTRLLVLTMDIPGKLSRGLEFRSQEMSMGRSPLDTIQEVDAISSELMGLSENSKGVRCGGTERIKSVPKHFPQSLEILDNY